MSILRLQHTRSDGEIDTYHLKSVRRYLIGRGSSCEVRILDMKMSRQHVAIDRQGSEWILHDLGSTNGARVNGVKIQGSMALQPGLEIRVGSTDLIVESIEDVEGVSVAEADITPVRQETLPGTETGDEIPNFHRSNDDDLFDDEPSPAPEHGTGPLNAVTDAMQGRTSDSSEFDLTEDHSPAAASALAPAPSYETSEPAFDLADEDDDILEPVTEVITAPEPEPTPEPAPSAVSSSESRTDSGRIKPITIRVGTGHTSAPAPIEAEPSAPEPIQPEPVASVEPPKPAPAPAPAPAPKPKAEPEPAQAAAPAPKRIMPARKPSTGIFSKSSSDPKPAASDAKPAVTLPKPVAGNEDSKLYINILGRRVGPITRATARELKSRELKGTLTESDLDNYLNL